MTRFHQTRWQGVDPVVPDKPITKKPAETRMGKGKGAPEEWVAVIRPGKVLPEMEGVGARGRTAGDAARGAQAPDEDQAYSPRDGGVESR